MLQLLHVLNLLYVLHNIIIITDVKLNDACNDIPMYKQLVELQVKLHLLSWSVSVCAKCYHLVKTLINFLVNSQLNYYMIIVQYNIL